MPLTSDISSTSNNPLLVPTVEAWEKMTLLEQKIVEERIIEALDSQVEFMGETTNHFDVRVYATLLLRRFYQEQGRQVFVASDLYTLYPGEEAFYPDLLVVFDTPSHSRSSWIVANENKGLDFALEVLSKSTRQNDQVKKFNLYARLGIPEYFIFDPEKLQLKGYQLNNGLYQEIAQEEKGVFSAQLQLYLNNDDAMLRFSVKEGIEIPFAEEIIDNLNSKLAKKEQRIIDVVRERDQILEETEQQITDLTNELDQIVEDRNQQKEKAEQEAERAERAEREAEREAERAEREAEKAKKAEAEIQRLKALLENK